jgi:hypothetical protein
MAQEEYGLDDRDLFLLGHITEEARNKGRRWQQLPKGCSEDQVLRLEKAGYLVLVRPSGDDETISLRNCRITDAGRKAWEAYRIDV